MTLSICKMTVAFYECNFLSNIITADLFIVQQILHWSNDVMLCAVIFPRISRMIKNRKKQLVNDSVLSSTRAYRYITFEMCERIALSKLSKCVYLRGKCCKILKNIAKKEDWCEISFLITPCPYVFSINVLTIMDGANFEFLE